MGLLRQSYVKRFLKNSWTIQGDANGKYLERNSLLFAKHGKDISNYDLLEIVDDQAECAPFNSREIDEELDVVIP